MELDWAEVKRYLRMGGAPIDGALGARLERVAAAVQQAARPAAYWQLVPIEWRGPADYRGGPLALTSRKLAATLAGCRHAFLFCATLGAGVDALLRRYSQTSGADALMAQAAATAAIEGWCDACAEKLLAEPAVAGERLRMRFSPGYGDLPLAVQRPLLQILDSARRAGIVLTETCLMIPSKSVSAIIGVGPEPAASCPAGCRACSKTECEYRTC